VQSGLSSLLPSVRVGRSKIFANEPISHSDTCWSGTHADTLMYSPVRYGRMRANERAAPTLAKCERAANFLSRVTFDPRAASLVSKSNSRLLKSSVCLRRITNWHLCDGSGESWSSRSTPITRRLNMCWLMVFNAVKNYYYKVHQRQCRDCYRRWKNDAVWVFYDAMKNSH
jgi:hypothetical protein